MTVKVAAIASLACCMIAAAQGVQERELARQLGAGAIAKLAASRAVDVALLLRWMENPPPGVDPHELAVGLSDALGSLRVRRAIPALIRFIGLKRYVFDSLNIWLKTTEVVEERLPCVAALIQIGPEASNAVMDAWDGLSYNDRLPAIVVISRVKGVPRARAFLQSVSSQANVERVWAEEGMKMQSETDAVAK